MSKLGGAYQEENKDFQIDNDYIEDDPLAIDLEIGGVTKIVEVPLDIVGVYSFPPGLTAEEKRKNGKNGRGNASCFTLAG